MCTVRCRVHPEERWGGAAGPWGADSTVSPQQNVFVSGVCGTVFVDLILYVWSLD